MSASSSANSALNDPSSWTRESEEAIVLGERGCVPNLVPTCRVFLNQIVRLAKKYECFGI